MEPDNTLLDDYILGLTSVAKPRAVTLTGIDNFYQAFMPGALPTVAPVAVPSTVIGPAHGRDHGPTCWRSWRLHGVDWALRHAWVSGTALCGLNAGSLCWFEAGTTDAFGRGLEPSSTASGACLGAFVAL